MLRAPDVKCLLAMTALFGVVLPLAQGAPVRRLLQTTAQRGGACGSAANARCPSGQCCSQYGWCGITSAHCSATCQPLFSAADSACRGAATPPAPPVTPPPAPPVVPPPAPPVATPPAPGCVDTYAACPGWGPGSCIFGGVPALCPCMCSGGSSGVVSGPPPPSPPTQAPVQPPTQPQPPAGGAMTTSSGVSYHLYDTVSFPAIPEAGAAAQTLPGSNPGYTINNLFCTDYMLNNPGIAWSSVPWTATTGTAQGVLKCGDRVCITNRRNGATATAYVVDQGGKGSPTGFDLDYARVFKVLDPDNQNYLRGSMDIDWVKC